ncbi:hypothetical protein [Chitinophaga pinensis]|uniref:Lipoprotein n=1 Tax=Chitinophaga pinensis TaxID=79329 RepID=A0A5C6LKJ9_9BACT|nr:hypothetical protein [Chitinophaga pinensis]TWV93955.1 hypothetical protein FEF09_26340 [Chitinophaga pinensis]
MNTKALFSLFSLAVLCFACSKDKQTNPFGDDVKESYKSGTTLEIQDLALYTKTGIVYDAETIKQFLDIHLPDEQSSLRKYFYWNQTSATDHHIAIAVDFLADNKVRFNTKLTQIISKTDTSMVLEEIDATDVPKAGTAPCDVAHDKVAKITPLSNCPGGACTTYRKTYPIMIKGGKYYLPTLYFMAINTHIEYVFGMPATITCFKLSQDYPMLNFVNPALSEAMTANDTILVQSAQIALEKK